MTDLGNTSEEESLGALIKRLVHQDKDWREIAGEIVEATWKKMLVRQTIKYIYRNMRNGLQLDEEHFEEDVRSIFSEKLLRLRYERGREDVDYEIRTRMFAKNAARETIRSLGRKRETHLPAKAMEEMVAEKEDDDSCSEERLEAGLEALRRCVQRLDENQRKIWQLVHEGRSYAEVGEIMGRQKDSVHRTVRRVMVELEKCIREHLG